MDDELLRGGVIIAGGRSTRFGDRDKVLANLAGVSMIYRVADRLSTVVDELVVNCRTDQTAAIERALPGMAVEFAEDPDPDGGPLAGVHTGLSALDADYAAVVAADMPLVEPQFLSSLFERAAGRDAAVPRHNGWFQPTQAVYRTDAMIDACTAALARGDRALRAALSSLDLVVIEETERPDSVSSATFTNVNTPEAFAAAERAIETTR